MPGLRERQKEKRETSILTAASELFNSKGYNNTSIEEIAERAEVGVGTIYNYFHTKADLILALARQVTDELLEEGQVIIDNPPHEAQEAVTTLLSIYAEGMMSKWYNKDLIRELFEVALSEQLSYRRETVKLDFELVDQLAKLMEHIKKHSQLAEEINPYEAATLLYIVAMIDVLMFIIDNETSLDTLTEAIHRRVSLVFRGLSPK